MKTAVKKRTYNLDGEKIEKARRLFVVKTDTEAIGRALGKAIADDEIERSLEDLLREGSFRAIYR